MCLWKNKNDECDLYSETGKDPLLAQLNCNEEGKCMGPCEAME